ncbi:hypothetical protein ACWF9B_22090 [Streptomyces sp. NPDC055089]
MPACHPTRRPPGKCVSAHRTDPKAHTITPLRGRDRLTADQLAALANLGLDWTS